MPPTEEEIKEWFERDLSLTKLDTMLFVINFEEALWLSGYKRGLQAAKEVYAGLKEGSNDK